MESLAISCPAGRNIIPSFHWCMVATLARKIADSAGNGKESRHSLVTDM